MIKAFYNTISLTGPELKAAVTNAENQDTAILLLFNTGKPYTPSQILRLMEKAGKRYPITSIRRSITNLTSLGKLVKTGLMQEGIYGKPEHTWIKKTL